jgi:hypothetical protein
MPKYKVIGKSRETGRKRSITHQAIDETAAKVQAENDGIDVLEIVKLPEDPPTERQIEYAQKLGIIIPFGATKDELSNLISTAVDKDKPCNPRHVEFANMYRVNCTKYVGKKLLFDRIQDELIKPGNELNMISWFAFRVYRQLVSGIINPELDDPRNFIFISIAQELVSDENVIKSIKRYKGRDLIWFGDWTSPNGYLMCGGSVQTIAYKTVSKRLKDKISINANITNVNIDKSKIVASNSGKGCFSIMIGFLLPAIAFLVYLSKEYICQN